MATTISAATSSKPILRDNDPSWSKVPYQVQLGETFESMATALMYLCETNSAGVPKGTNASVASVSGLGEFVGVPNYYGHSYFKDTRLGMNDAINCIWQFNRDDDIVHPLTQSDPTVPGLGEGRVYSKTTETNQSIAWFTFGVPRFTNLAKFFLNAADADIARMNNTGLNAGFSLGYIFQSVVETAALAFTLPVGMVQAFSEAVKFLTDYNCDKFYTLRPTMHLYYKYVDSILAEWLVDTGLYGNGTVQGKAVMDAALRTEVSENDVLNISYNSWTADSDSLPIALRMTGLSIYDVLARKAIALGTTANNSAEAFQDEVDRLINLTEDDYDTKDNGEWSGFGLATMDDVLVKTMFGATQFVGFRIEKSMDASESFTNSTGPSEIAEQINSMSKSNLNKRYDFAGGEMEKILGDNPVGSLVSGLQGVMNSMLDSLNLDNIASALTGGVLLDVPEHYTGSDFGKSHSFNFQLRAPYGDLVSIYQSIIVPLAMLLAGALPHAAGANAYSQPFICRVYSKGLFSIPMGIIDSLSIKRGSSEFGWNYNNLPTCIDVSMTIKDLSPAMYMPIASETFTNIFAANSSFSEYMLTLSGTGLWDRLSRMAQIRRRTQLLCHKVRNQIINPMYWASKGADTDILRVVSSILPGNYISND